MRLTATIPDDLAETVRECRMVAEAVTIALKDWVDMRGIKELNRKIEQNPIRLSDGAQIRETNRSV